MDIHYTPVTNLNLSAKEWELYYDNKSANEVANIMNKELSKAINNAWENVNKGNNYQECLLDLQKTYEKLVEENPSVGISDTEPRAVFKKILETVFNKEVIESLQKVNNKKYKL